MAFKMADVESDKLRFRPRARIIRTIGDQLISGPEAAVIELVKNAYDADASTVTIKFFPPLEVGKGRIVVSDDGHGMTLQDIQEKWMEPATAAKVGNRMSPVKHRTMMGSKGIGRFAAAKLGSKMALNSISVRSGASVEVLIPELDWSIFNEDTYLSDVAIDYLTQTSELPTGTTIEITELAEAWPSEKVTSLHVELRRLISPFEQGTGPQGFKIFMDLSECTEENSGFSGSALFGHRVDGRPEDAVELSFEVQPFPILTTSDYEVDGYFDPEGVFHGTMEIRRAGQAPRPVELKVPIPTGQTACGKVLVHLYIFDREASVVRQTIRNAGLGEVTASEARRILDSISGVAIYRGGFRVRPYGDETNDWLVLDKRRVQNPSLRIGHNQVAGFVTVQDQHSSGLLEKSSREGFEQNGAFQRLQSLLTELLARVVEPRRNVFRDNAGLSRSNRTSFDEVRQLSALSKLRQLIPSMPAGEQESASLLIDEQSKLLTDKIAALEDRQRILEAQSSLGQIIAEVLHEGAPSATYLEVTSERLRTRYQHLVVESKLTEQTRREFPEKLHLMKTNASKLSGLFAVLRPLAGVKRGPPQYFRGEQLAHDIFRIFDGSNVRLKVHNSQNLPQLLGYPEDLNTALVNLVGNSVHWLEQSETADPAVDIYFNAEGKWMTIMVEDNGPGIAEEFVTQIFDVGFTLKDGGTGLGLNIAREALSRSGAKLGYHLGSKQGAQFEILFPCWGG